MTTVGISQWFDVRIKICLYSLIWGCALEIVNVTEAQYIYAYLKSHTSTNITSGHTYTTNTSLNKDNCGDNSTGTTDDQVQGLASDWTWYMELVIYSPGLLVMSVLGPLSDQLGRKPIIIGTVTLFIITFMLRTYAVYAGLTLYWYLLFCAVEGLAGCHYTFDVACLAILTDYSSMEESKPFNLALFDTMMVIGICTSQIAAGYMIKWTGYTYPFLTGACVLVFLLILIILTLTEDVPLSHKRKYCAIFPLSKDVFMICTNHNVFISTTRKIFLIYLVIFVVTRFPFTANTTIRILYELGSPFCWSSVKIGWYTAGTYFWEYIVGIFIFKALLLFFTDVKILFFGYVSYIISLVIFGFSTSDWMIYLGMYILSLDSSN